MHVVHFNIRRKADLLFPHTASACTNRDCVYQHQDQGEIASNYFGGKKIP